MRSVCVVSSSLLLAGSAWALNVPIHTLHHINDANHASWQGRLVIASANEPAYFTNKNGVNEGEIYDFTLNNKTAPFVYGFAFKRGANFNVSYTLTLYQSTHHFEGPLSHSFFSSKGCQFNISAKGPAQPDIRIEKYNGAICSFKIVPGQGEDFTVS